MAAPAPASIVAWTRSPPVGMIALAELVGFPHTVDLDEGGKGTTERLVLPTGQALAGQAAALRFIARSAGAAGRAYLGGDDPMAAHEVDELLAFSGSLGPGLGLEAACLALDAHLALRSHLVGHGLTAADLACWAALSNNPQAGKVLSSGRAPHLARWFAHVGAQPAVAAAHAATDWKSRPRGERETSQRAAEVTGKAKGEGGSFDIDLPGAVRGQVVTRFPPEPSGYLHIGHAKAALLNDILAKVYDGKLIIRFDDTNPSKEKDEFVENIMKDIHTLGLTYCKVTYTSDYFDQLLRLGEDLVKRGHLYADDTPVEQMRAERMAKQPSAKRGRSVEENLRLFEEMKKGSPEGCANCMRVKMDPGSNNGCLRDPVAFRCNVDVPHHRTGSKYKVYPTYDFACPFVDSYEGVTHSLRTNEYADREPQFQWMLKLQKVSE